MERTKQKIHELVEEIFLLYQQHGGDEYIGEPVSRMEHMSQAAVLALKEGYEDEVVLAAFFHDIGHICTLKGNTSRMGSYGLMDHEKLGADFLKSGGFSERITTLIANHVPAKRYLTFKDPGYYRSLSDASKKTLAFQGGVMSSEEAMAFERSPYFKESVRLRQWDEQAKELNKPLLDAEILKEMARDHLIQNTLPQH